MRLKSEDGWVYFIECEASKSVKIGRAKRPSNRLAQLQTSTPNTLKIAAVLPGCRKVERQVHKTHAGSHIRGEWYKLDFALQCRIEAARAKYGEPWKRSASPTTLERVRARLEALYDDVLSGKRTISDSSDMSKYRHIWHAIVAERGDVETFAKQSAENRAKYARLTSARVKEWRAALLRGEDPPDWKS